MKIHAALWAAAGLVMAANGLALLHASRNRAGEPVQTVTLSEKELKWSPSSDDSSVTLRLSWVGRFDSHLRLSEQRIAALGFDIASDRNDKEPWRSFRRQAARRAYVAFEVGGPDRGEREGQEGRSRLVPVDAALDGGSLVAKYGGRGNVVSLPVSIRPYLRREAALPGGQSVERTFVDLQIIDIPNEIHVPLPLAAQWKGRSSGSEYEVTLEYGRFYEPRVVGVRFR